MKQTFLMLVAFFAASLFATAQTEHSVTINAGDIEHLSVVDNMEILLLQGNAEDKISIDKDVFEKLDEERIGNLLMRVCSDEETQVLITDTSCQRLEQQMQKLNLPMQLIGL